MRKKIKVGNYIGREINLCPSSSLSKNINEYKISTATVLFWISEKDRLDNFNLHIRNLIKENPLSIFVAGLGENIDSAFDYLLHCLDSDKPSSQIMTRYSRNSLQDCLEEFLQATWPSEDRFDEWAEYLIVSDENEIENVLKEARLLCS